MKIPALALHVAGRFSAPATYQAHLQEAGLEHPSLVEEGATYTTAHARHVGRTFALSYERLDPALPVDALARDLLARAAYFALGEPLLRALLLATLQHTDDFGAPRNPVHTLFSTLKRWFGRREKSQNHTSFEQQSEDALARLVALGLLETEDAGDLLLHRLLATFVRETEGDTEAQTAVEVTVLDEAERLNEASYPAPLLAWQPHLRHVTAAALSREDARATTLCNELGVHLDILGDYAGARPYYERALVIREQVLGPDHPATATSLNNLGLLLDNMGDLEGAARLLQRALRIREAVLGPEHPNTQNARRSLANIEAAIARRAGE